MEMLLLAAAAHVVDLAAARRLVEFQEQVGHVVGVNLIAYLLSLVAVDLVFLAGHGADDDVDQIAVQLDGRMLRSGETAAAEDADGHLEVAAELLAHDVRGDLRGAEDGMQAVIDRHVLVDAVQAVGVIPTLIEFA